MSALKFAAVGAPAAAVYVEDVFSTYLYNGTGATQTITNGIDLSTKGGLVWLKQRTAISWTAATQHDLFDSARGLTKIHHTNLTNASDNFGAAPITFNSNGFTIDSDGSGYGYNKSTETYVGWTFRKQSKFFDIVTYTGNGVAGRQISHNLGSVPGFIVVKCTSNATIWAGYHRSLGATTLIRLNTTDAAITNSTMWNDTEPTSTVFSVGTAQGTNQATLTYVAYLFAHDAGGFGATSADNVISCGSFTGTSKVTLGYEPQFFIMKQTNTAGAWYLYDTMRGIFADASNNNDPYLMANASSAEATGQNFIGIDATGFTPSSAAVGPSSTFIYIAIRRGPMKVPTLGTTVFSPALGSGTAPGYVSGFPVDLGIERNKGSVANTEAGSRLTGATVLKTNLTNAESASTNTKFDYMNGFFAGTKGTNEIAWMFRRAPGFFDEVCYTGTGVDGGTINHNLTVSPELTIIKMRSGSTTRGWRTYTPGAIGALKYGMLDLSNAFESPPYIPSVSSTTVTLSTDQEVNGINNLYVAYLFATCPGVSKVGSYTGNGSNQTINCGFTGGARFILIKRTDAVGDWYVWDSTRGIVAANDPHLSPNTTAAEVTTDDSVDTDSSGFIVNQLAATNINVSAATYIFLSCS